MTEEAELDYLYSFAIRAWKPAPLGRLFRHCLDRAIDFPATGVVRVEDIQKAAKTAIGTHVEVGLRNLIGLPHGAKLDLLFPNGVEADIKWSTGQNGKPGNSFMIPTETFGHFAFLATAWDTPGASFFSLGLISIDPDGENLSAPNKDKKRGIPKRTLDKARWLYQRNPMPANIFLSQPEADLQRVFDAQAGLPRMLMALKTFGAISAEQMLLFDVPEPSHRIPELVELLAEEQYRLEVDSDFVWRCLPND